MSWDNFGITEWSKGGLMFAPYSLVALTLIRAVQQRNLINGPAFNTPDEKLPFSPHLEGRASIGGSGTPQPIGSSVNRIGLGTLVELDRLIVGSWGGGDSFSNTVWVNYKDNDGNWNKSETAPPLWTSETILEELEQDEYIRLRYQVGDEEFPDNLYYFVPLLASWANQCYKMLNLFRWTRERWNFLANPLPDSFYFKRAEGNTYADMVANWPDNWTLQTDTVLSGDHAQTDGNDGGLVKGERVYISDAQNQGYGSPTDELTRDDDLYWYTQKAGDRFNPDGNDWSENTWGIVTKLQQQQNTGFNWDNREFLSNAPTPNPHNEETVGWFVDQRASAGNPVGVAGYTVQKWDVDGGLTYID